MDNQLHKYPKKLSRLAQAKEARAKAKEEYEALIKLDTLSDRQKIRAQECAKALGLTWREIPERIWHVGHYQARDAEGALELSFEPEIVAASAPTTNPRLLALRAKRAAAVVASQVPVAKPAFNEEEMRKIEGKIGELRSKQSALGLNPNELDELLMCESWWL
jgi:hypothetical protein